MTDTEKALRDLERLNAAELCMIAHHDKADRHCIDAPCPVAQRIVTGLAAIRALLAEVEALRRYKSTTAPRIEALERICVKDRQPCSEDGSAVVPFAALMAGAQALAAAPEVPR